MKIELELTDEVLDILSGIDEDVSKAVTVLCMEHEYLLSQQADECNFDERI